MPRPHRLPHPLSLFALLVGLAGGACGGTLYDASGVPLVDANGCGVGTHLCPSALECVPQDVAACGDTCGPCTSAPPGGAPACLLAAGGTYACGHTCTAPARACGDLCFEQSVQHCGTFCDPCGASPANGTRTCDARSGAYTCEYDCQPGFFKVNGGCARPVAVAAGAQHTCAVVEGGALLCWGGNAAGQLGPATAAVSSVTPQVVLGSGAVAVAAGGRHTCAVVGAARTVLCWGANDQGQLGRGTTGAASPDPAQAGTLSGVDQLVAGADHTCARMGGAVSCWGANALGQVGTGATSATPVASPAASVVASGATDLSARADTTCALVGAALRCWGANGSGQTGKGSASTAEAAAVTVQGLPAAPVAVAVGARHACAIASGLGLFCWGDNADWQLGGGDRAGAGGAGPFLAPVAADRVDNGAKADQYLIAGGAFTCATRSGEAQPTIKCGGLNTELQSGPPAVPPASHIDRSDVAPGGAILHLAAGNAHSCELVDVPVAGVQVRCWGRNAEGQLGRPTSGGAPDGTPAPVPP